jgi:leucyl-tRNA synthetase
MDHDRASGEGVGVQEYTCIKLRVVLEELQECMKYKVKDVAVGSKLASLQSALHGRKVFLVAATLRPETMYGQTNCYVGVDIDYGIYAVNDKEAWVCTERAARNMAFQGLFEEKGQMKKLADIKGWDLVGLPLSAPLASYKKVYTLPMEGVLVTKGTGVVTSVPSDSPDDYITMMDLLKKPAYYHIQKEWVEPFLPPIPIIETPNFGNLAAVKAVTDLKIASQKDKVNLAKAKEMVYKEGFYQGKLIVGDFAGKPVQEAKPLIRAALIASGDAFPYCEPEGQVISRSGDECVVTLAAQWYMDYGEESWKQKALECLAKMDTFGVETRNQFEKNLDWLGQWACSRSFGLGSRLPWDKQWLIESLSDSTIYMAYYTVAHLLHEGSLDGSKPGAANILPEQMTDEVWSYIMLDGPVPADCKIPVKTLEILRREFRYFYPLDLRCSGKDLVTNHLTFFIYNHTAIFPKENWPKAVRSNGHLLLNNAKMSKSTGNFLTLQEALSKYGADATRFALADAGDGLEDANFLEKTADDAILKLYTEKEWIQETLSDIEKGVLRTGEWSWNDKVFDCEMNRLIEAADKTYEAMLYRETLKNAFYDMQNIRGEYRKVTTGRGLVSVNVDNEVFEGMHKDLVLKFIETLAIMMVPITPHFSEHVWMDLLKKPVSIMKALWPKVKTTDESLIAASSYIRGIGSAIRSAEDVAARKKAKKGAVATEQASADSETKTLRLFMAESFPEWQEQTIDILKACWNEVDFLYSLKRFIGNQKF